MMLEYKYNLKIFIGIRNFGAIMKKYRRRYGYKRILAAFIAADLLCKLRTGSAPSEISLTMAAVGPLVCWLRWRLTGTSSGRQP